MDLKVVAPGHGPFGTTEDLLLGKQYLADLSNMAGRVVKEGGSEDDAAALPIPAPYDTWIDGMGRFDVNMRHLHKTLSEPNQPD